LRRLLQVLFGFVLGLMVFVVSSYLGAMARATALLLLLVVVITQWMSWWVFRRRIALQVLAGVVLCLAITCGLLFSSLPMFWENEEAIQPGVYTITWRSQLMFLLLLALGQGISFVLFRWFKREQGTQSRIRDPGILH
jgi:4-amino-4-deoxy-L-arabinose transferase-like glycosyltransferase